LFTYSIIGWFNHHRSHLPLTSKEKSMSKIRLWVLRVTLVVIGVGQTALGLLLIFLPGKYAHLYGVVDAPGWANRLMGVLGVRAAGFGIGMLFALRNPVRYRTWLLAMISIQASDMVISLVYLATGHATLAETSPAPFAPFLFLAGLMIGWPAARGGIRDG